MVQHDDPIGAALDTMNKNPKFSLQIVLATSELDQLIDGGSIDLDGFIHKFRHFDWSGEVSREYWNRKSSPGLGVFNQKNGSTLWTSAWDWLSLLSKSGAPAHEPALSFVVGLNNGPKPPDIYCRKEDRGVTTLRFAADSPVIVERLFTLYFGDHYDDLYRDLFKLSVA